MFFITFHADMFKERPPKPSPMREARLSWEFSSIENTDFAPLLEVCKSFEVVAHLDITEDGIKQLVHLHLAEDRGISELESIPFLYLEGPLPPYELPDIGGEGYAIIWNKHNLTSVARNFDDIAVIPPYRFDSSGLSLSVRGLPKGISNFVKMMKVFFPPDKVRVVDLENDDAAIKRILTEKQQTILKEAIKHGYYGQPRKIGLGELSEIVSVPRSSLGDLLMRLESNLAIWAFEQLE